MKITELIERLSKIGTVEICKAGAVFVLLMKGEKLTASSRIISVQMHVVEFCGDKYPIIEVMRNDDDYICMVLKPKKD